MGSTVRVANTLPDDHGERRSIPTPEGANSDRLQQVLASVTKALDLYVREVEPGALFTELLGDLLSLADSDYGYIGEVLYDEQGSPYLKTWAITNIAWNEETRALYEEHVVRGGGLEFRNLDTIFGWGLREGGRLVIANETATDPRSSGRPGGHPPLDSYLGVPIFHGPELVGQFGVSNRPGGYHDDLVHDLEPFTAALGNLINGYRAERERSQAQEALAQSERWLATLFNHLSDVVTVLDADGAWISSSPAGSRLLDYPRGFDIPGGVFSLLHPDDYVLAADAFAAVLAGERGPDEPVELRVRAMDGTYHVFETVGEDLRHEPAVGGVVLTSRDVTERRNAEEGLREATAELTALLENLHDAVLFVEDQRRIVFVNERFCELFGYDDEPGDLVGQSTFEIQGRARELVDDAVSFAARIDAIYARQEQVEDELVRLADGRVFERDYTPVTLGPDRRGHLWLYRDVTARVAIDEQRAQILAHEREMRESIEEQNRSLRELDRLKTDFVATVSHELRTPLSSIVGFADFLAEDADALAGEQREYVEIIHRNADRLLQLVGDLLLVARLESGGLAIDPGPVDLEPLIEAAATAIGPDSAAGQIELEVDLSADRSPVVADSGRLEQVIANLLSNAVKFTPAGGRVRVSTRRTRGAWDIVVADNGIGIPAAELDRLFERFFRGTNVRLEELPGTGLGLAICKAIVDLHGGELDIASEENVGTTVTVHLPDKPAVPS